LFNRIRGVGNNNNNKGKGKSKKEGAGRQEDIGGHGNAKQEEGTNCTHAR